MQRARRVQTSGVPHLVRGAGEHYLPLPNARLVESHAGDDPSDLVVFAPAGTPVHAVCAGTVSDGDDTTLRIEGEDGHTFVYQTVQDRRVAPGERVDAGAIVGVIGAVGDRHVLRLAVTGRGDAPARPHELLLGAVDPNELGYGPAGTGTDLDPDASAASRAAPAAWTSAPAPVARRSADATPKPQPTAKPQPAPTRQPPPTTSRPVPSSATRPPTTAPPAPRATTPVRPAPAPPVGAVTPGRRRDPVSETPDDGDQAETVEDQQPRASGPEPRAGTAPTEKKPPVVIPPPPPPVPLLDRQKDETDDEPPAPSATRTEEQQRKRAAMLIASRRRPDDTGPKQ